MNFLLFEVQTVDVLEISLLPYECSMRYFTEIDALYSFHIHCVFEVELKKLSLLPVSRRQ
jgi:hypothetical protein